jgi:hypothetical protein
LFGICTNSNNRISHTCTATHLPWRAVPGNAVRRKCGVGGAFGLNLINDIFKLN